MSDNTARKGSAKPSPTPAGTPDAKANRRRSDRRPYVAEAWLVAKDNPDSRTDVKTVNLSKHGIAFDLSKKADPGTFFLLEIGFGQQRLVAEIRIISCRAISEGIFEIGAEFC